jgi:hypothetical protein
LRLRETPNIIEPRRILQQPIRQDWWLVLYFILDKESTYMAKQRRPKS